MNNIAIIDTVIGKNFLRFTTCINYYLHNDCKNINHINHGTLCAMVLENCTNNYNLINICAFSELNTQKNTCNIKALIKALELCGNLHIDIISLSAATSILSDSKYLYDLTYELSKNTVIVSALDNKRYLSVPASYKHIYGVQCDTKNILPLKDIAYCKDEPLNANIIANCNFEFLNKYGYSMSNSFAVPVAVGYINNLLNSGVNKKQISSKLHSLQKYDVSDLYKKFLTNQNDSIPIVFLIDNSNILCQKYMDIFYHQYEVQATAISTIFDTEDIRIKKVTNLTNISKDILFMSYYYKTDLIFIIGNIEEFNDIKQKIDIDIKIVRNNQHVMLSFEGKHSECTEQNTVKFIHDILTTQP